MMLGHTANAKKASKFEDSDGSGMPRPRSVSELPQRPSARLKASASSEARRPVGARGGTAPRSPLHEKKPVSAGAGSRVAELEAKLEKAHGQLAAMREQLAAAEKARKDARAALVEAKKRFAAKKRDGDVAPSAVEGNGVNGGMSMVATDVVDAVVPSEPEDPKADQVGSNAIPNPEPVDELRAKLMAKDMEAYELRAKLMVRDTEVDELRGTLMAKDTELDELRGKLASNDTEINKLAANLMAKDADNAELTRMAEEAAKARARETEHALREARLADLLRASEAEAQRARVQSEQWRKAAEEAAVVLGAGGGAPGAAGTASAEKRRHSSSGPGAGEGTVAEEEGASGKRKSGGAMRVLSDLWKKKLQK